MPERVYGNPAVPRPDKPLSFKDELFFYLGAHPYIWKLEGDNLREELKDVVLSDEHIAWRDGCPCEMPDGTWLISPAEKAARTKAINEVVHYMDHYRRYWLINEADYA